MFNAHIAVFVLILALMATVHLLRLILFCWSVGEVCSQILLPGPVSGQPFLCGPQSSGR